MDEQGTTGGGGTDHVAEAGAGGEAPLTPHWSDRALRVGLNLIVAGFAGAAVLEPVIYLCGWSAAAIGPLPLQWAVRGIGGAVAVASFGAAISAVGGLARWLRPRGWRSPAYPALLYIPGTALATTLALGIAVLLALPLALGANGSKRLLDDWRSLLENRWLYRKNSADEPRPTFAIEQQAATLRRLDIATQRVPTRTR
jgi:hypothetical protein